MTVPCAESHNLQGLPAQNRWVRKCKVTHKLKTGNWSPSPKPDAHPLSQRLPLIPPIRVSQAVLVILAQCCYRLPLWDHSSLVTHAHLGWLVMAELVMTWMNVSLGLPVIRPVPTPLAHSSVPALQLMPWDPMADRVLTSMSAWSVSWRMNIIQQVLLP